MAGMNAPARTPLLVQPPLAGELPEETEVVAFARSLVERSQASPRERRSASRLDRILSDTESRDVLMGLTDEVLRIGDAERSLHRLNQLVQGDLKGFGLIDRTALRAAGLVDRIVPRPLRRPVKHIVDRRIISETRGVILPAEADRIGPALVDIRADGCAANVNLLGESILGDDEAERRLQAVIAQLQRPDIDYVSVKISALCANLDVLAFDASVERIKERLRQIFRTAAARRPVGFVNLDMEEYRDLRLTIAAFTSVLDEPEFVHLEAGIVLQAYLPDSVEALEELATWSSSRRDRGGAGIKIRIVKGANLAMEQVEAQLHGWDQAPYDGKEAVDANLKRLVIRALDPSLEGAIRLGLGSHNLFDVAFAVLLARRWGQSHRLELEMLAGMAPAQARVAGAEQPLRIYAPVVNESEMEAAIAYLARRLDENATPQNFLRNALRITEPAVFQQESVRFVDALRAWNTTSTSSRRQRVGDDHAKHATPSSQFVNEPDSDFTVGRIRVEVQRALSLPLDALQVDYTLVESIEDVDRLVATSVASRTQGGNAERIGWLHSLASVMADDRFRTLALMAKTTGKTIREGDPEVSEAIDAARYAATVGASLLDDLRADGLQVSPNGTVVVAAPWNFPYAIPTLGVASALMAGNSVILKPAPEAVEVGALIVDQCQRAGIPVGVVQLAVCADGPVASRLVTHPDVAQVVLTGSSQTARFLLGLKPEMDLSAETSGKNGLIITEAADVDAAIRDLVRSAFGHAGQKCSAASLAILVGDIGKRADVLERLADAVRSLRVGVAHDIHTIVGPLIGEPSQALLRALTQLDSGERWLVEPKRLESDADVIWTPGVRVGVREGSWFHRTECFGPVLGVICVDTLEDAIRVQNSTGFGLTGGIHSLDPSEVELWLRSVEVGNAYVNRHITGAIVGRQPFGGWKQSSMGGGSKPGGPDHILNFVRVRANSLGDGASQRASYRASLKSLFGNDTDPSALSAEYNVLRHHRLSGVLVWRKDVDRASLESLRLASELTGTPLLSADDEAAAIAIIASEKVERLRVLGHVPTSMLIAAHEHGVAVDRTPATGHGRVELGRWVREQAISVTAHRHGRLVDTMREPLQASRRASA
jgi:RHH-type transcriptional regulator, proline utilization regulon repressor / proline dehydrogenase / delta 1-pyrroline-5-carboxylate dehydrogenase